MKRRMEIRQFTFPQKNIKEGICLRSSEITATLQLVHLLPTQSKLDKLFYAVKKDCLLREAVFPSHQLINIQYRDGAKMACPSSLFAFTV